MADDKTNATAEADETVVVSNEALLKAEAAADQYLVSQVYVCGGRSADARCGR